MPRVISYDGMSYRMCALSECEATFFSEASDFRYCMTEGGKGYI